MAPVDPHSYTDGAHPVTAHAALAFYLDFAASTIHASALVTLSAPHTGDLLLDTRALAVHSAATAPAPDAAPFPIPFSLAADADPVLGTALTLALPPDTASFLLTFSTSPAASALQWLAPPQTASGLPFVFSQCQSIHARSVFPCHDTPAARITYSLLLNVPAQLSAVAAARHVARRDPVPSDHRGACDDALWCAPGRIVEEFEMAQCVPPYLFAFAAGGIGSRDLGPRTRVYAEGGDTLLDDAAREFAGVEDMVKVGESLFGPYEWERFDLLVLPPSFPYGGMENPRMVFLTPTVIKGDAAGAQVVAHELAHSWTGNLITNKTNEDFWLNEGFTTYAERRIVEVVQGEERAALNSGIGWRGLNRMMERFKDNMEFTKLKPKMAGIDPDDVYSEVPYEKGFQFLWRIERQIGRPAFDEFLKKYIANFKFQSIDTETFLEFLRANVPGIENQVDLHEWINGTGLPPDAMEPESATYKKICVLAAEFKSGKIPSEEEVTALDERYKLSESRDYEVKVAFLQLAIPTGCRCYFNEVEKCLKQVGRMKYLRPLYSSLARCSGEEEKMLAKRIFSEAQEFYHPIARGVAESILLKHG
ncbi:hypothetical protein VPH35_100999 [Triticum aestivum]